MMTSKLRSITKALAVILVALAVLMQLDILVIQTLDAYKFWLVVIAFGLMLVVSR
jgi:hypothetical protein